MTLGLGLLLVSVLVLLPLVALAFFLISRYIVRLPALSGFQRLAYLALMVIVLSPIAWPYVERAMAEHQCVAIQNLNEISTLRTNSIRIRLNVDEGVYSPDYLLIDTLGNPEWIQKNEVQYYFTEYGTSEFRALTPGTKCDLSSDWQQFGKGLCRRVGPKSDAPAGLEIQIRTVGASDNKGSESLVTFSDGHAKKVVAKFRSFYWFPTIGSFVLGSDRPFTCGDRYDFSKFLQSLLGH